jgi:hypothetical protein
VIYGHNATLTVNGKKIGDVVSFTGAWVAPEGEPVFECQYAIETACYNPPEKPKTFWERAADFINWIAPEVEYDGGYGTPA